MDKKLSFEDALAKLDEIVARLECGDCALDEMIALSEEGTKYADHCEKLLNQYEKRLTKLSIKKEA